MAAQPVCPGVAWSTLWFLCMITLGFPVAWIVAIFYVLLLPWGACFKPVRTFCDTMLMRVITFPLVMAERMLEMRPFPCCDKGPAGEGGEMDGGATTTHTTVTVTTETRSAVVAVTAASGGTNNSGFHGDSKSRSSSTSSSNSDHSGKEVDYGNPI